MLTIEKADVLVVAPELTDVDQAVFDAHIVMAEDEISSAIGSQYRMDRCGTYLVAHLLTEWKRRQSSGGGGSSVAGSLVEVTVGKVSQKWASSSSSSGGSSATSAGLQSTSYGVEYLRLIRIYLGVAATVAGGLGPIPGCE